MTTVERRPRGVLPLPEAAADGEADVERLREHVATLLAKNEQLQQALETRIVIEQAKGVLSERYRISIDEAFELLRRSARNNRLRIHALATAVVASHETPGAISSPDAAA